MCLLNILLLFVFTQSFNAFDLKASFSFSLLQCDFYIKLKGMCQKAMTFPIRFRQKLGSWQESPMSWGALYAGDPDSFYGTAMSKT